MSNMIQKSTAQMQKAKKPITIQDYILSMKSGIAAALPSVMTPERFTRIATSAVSASPKLAACDPMSFVAAMMTAAQLGLEPNTPLGQAYLIPYGKNCQFQIGYKGLIDLAWRSGEIADIQAEVVCANDKWEYELGLTPKLRHIPADGNRGDPVRYYAVIRTKSGGTISAVMSKEEILDHAKKFSKSYSSGPWQTNFDEMAKKTVLKKALKYAPLKSDFVRGIAQDNSVKDTFSDDMADIPNIIDQDESTATDVAMEIPVDESTGEVIPLDAKY